MKKLYTLLFICCTLFLASCKMFGKKDKVAPSSKALALVIGNPFDFGLDSVIAFPVGANYNPKIISNESPENNGSFSSETKLTFSKNTTTKYDKRATTEFINSSEQDFDIRNILFYDKITGQTFPLINDTLHILSFGIHKEFKKPLVFYRVVKIDINKDNKYNSEDAVMLYTSDLRGKNFTQITPENEQFFDYFYYPETNTILIKTAIDIDKDNKFTEIDETNFREMKILDPHFGKEIFSKSLKDSLRQQINVLQ